MAACCLTYLATASETNVSSLELINEDGLMVSKSSEDSFPSPYSKASEVKGIHTTMHVTARDYGSDHLTYISVSPDSTIYFAINKQ